MLEFALYKVPKKMGWFKTKPQTDDDYAAPVNDEREANQVA